MEPLTLILLGIGLAGAAGFRVFVPPLLMAIGSGVGLIDLPQGNDWLGGPTAIAVLSVATVIEIAAYYIPLVDNLLDMLTTPLALLVGTLLAFSVMPEMEPWLQWISAALLGGGAAGGVQALTTLTRVASTGTTAGLGNPIVATGELAGAVALSLLALLAPVLAGLAVLLLLIVGIRVVARKRRRGASAGEE